MSKKRQQETEDLIFEKYSGDTVKKVRKIPKDSPTFESCGTVYTIDSGSSGGTMRILGSDRLMYSFEFKKDFPHQDYPIGAFVIFYYTKEDLTSIVTAVNLQQAGCRHDI